MCTTVGPLGVGLLVRRVKVLEKRKEGSGGREGVLGFKSGGEDVQGEKGKEVGEQTKIKRTLIGSSPQNQTSTTLCIS